MLFLFSFIEKLIAGYFEIIANAHSVRASLHGAV